MNVTAAYVIVFTLVFALGTEFGGEHILSPACIDDDRCTKPEEAILGVLALTWIVASIVLTIVGWRGHLPGARKSRTEP